MGKYLALWEIAGSRVPVDAKDRGAAWGFMLEMIKQDLKSGKLKDWGAFVGETNGYGIAEGTEVEMGNMNMRYAPYVNFKVHPIASLDQVGEVLKSMSG
jgi:hypothetical protein